MQYFFFLFIINFCLAQNVNDNSASFQKELNEFYTNKETSPLQKKDLKAFKGLDFYPISKKYIITAQLQRTENSAAFEMKTSTDRLPKYKVYAVLSFNLNGKQYKLNVYQSIKTGFEKVVDDYLFLPFSDLTSGNETYIGGRYLDLKISDINKTTIVLDFNKAYNPYCAYNYKYSCPLVPLENNLNVAIEAGVKKFHD